MLAHFKGSYASAEKLKKPLNKPDRITSFIPNFEVLLIKDKTACSIDCLYRITRRSDELCLDFNRTITVLLLCLQNS
jgi:hypothetical protein